MKERLQRAGCLLWIAIMLVAGGSGGWFSYHALRNVFNVQNTLAIALAVIAGLIILVLLAVVSFLILVANDPHYDTDTWSP